MSDSTVTEIAERFVACWSDQTNEPEPASAGARFAEVCGPTITVWHPAWQSGPEETTVTWPGREYAVHYFGHIGRNLPRVLRDYEIQNLRYFDGRTPDEIAVAFTATGIFDGSHYQLPMMHILTANGGKLERIETYVHEPHVDVISSAVLALVKEGDPGDLIEPLSVSDPSGSMKADHGVHRFASATE